MPARQFSQERIVRSIDRVLSRRDINLLSQEAYTFIYLHAGSIAHFSLEGWKHTYKDLRDFLNFFLVRNEYGVCLVDPPQFMNLSEENRKIILAIVDVCQRYREQIVSEIEEREARTAREIGMKLMSGELTLSELFRRKSQIEELILSNRADNDEKDPERAAFEIVP
jgi:hypothetical protein